MKSLEDIVSEFKGITLEQMSGVKLMNRSDVKYVTTVEHVHELLSSISHYYYIQEGQTGRINTYRTTYYDTPGMDMFLMHHNGRANREKVRIRSYSDNDLSFFEIKMKNNHGKTKKRRVQVTTSEPWRGEECSNLLNRYTNYDPGELIPTISNEFKRITLIDFAMSERVTVDFMLNFHNHSNGAEKELRDLAIIELKRDSLKYSNIEGVLIDLRIKPMGFSKYCIGSVLTDTSLKSNLFKRKIMAIDKITDHTNGLI